MNEWRELLVRGRLLMAAAALTMGCKKLEKKGPNFAVYKSRRPGERLLGEVRLIGD